MKYVYFGACTQQTQTIITSNSSEQFKKVIISVQCLLSEVVSRKFSQGCHMFYILYTIQLYNIHVELWKIYIGCQDIMKVAVALNVSGKFFVQLFSKFR